MRTKHTRLLLALLLCTLTACGSGGTSTQVTPTIDLVGTWRGPASAIYGVTRETGTAEIVVTKDETRLNYFATLVLPSTTIMVRTDSSRRDYDIHTGKGWGAVPIMGNPFTVHGSGGTYRLHANIDAPTGWRYAADCDRA